MSSNKWLISSDYVTQERFVKLNLGRPMSYNMKINKLLDVYDQLSLLSAGNVEVNGVLAVLESMAKTIPKDRFNQINGVRLENDSKKEE